MCFSSFRGEEFITFEQATDILRTELKYPEDRALHFVKRFDRNNDGRLSMAEFSQFRKTIEDAYDHISDTIIRKSINFYLNSLHSRPTNSLSKLTIGWTLNRNKIE